MAVTDQADELERLRRRVAELEAERATPPTPEEGRSRWRSIVSSILIVLSCLLAPLAVTAVWAHNQVSDTNQYVETVAPLASDPAVQDALANRVTAEIFARVDIESITAQTLAALGRLDLPPVAASALQGLQAPIVNGIESFTRTQVDKALASPQFAAVWEQANRVAHAELVRLLSGEQGGALSAQNGTVTLNLAPIVAQVKQQLVANGYGFASNIPTVNTSFTLVQSNAVTKAQGLFNLLNTLGVWLPIITLILFGLGVYLARDHRRALMLGSLGIVAAVLAIGVLLAVARPLYLDALPSTTPREAAGDVFDTLVRFLRTGLRTTALTFLVIALGAFFTGPSTSAVRTREALGKGIASLRGGAESKGLRTGRVGAFAFAHKRALDLSVAILGGLTLVFWDRPDGKVVLVTALVVLVLVGLIEFIARPPAVALSVAPSGGDPRTPVA
ncbi:hypothetical protein [Intrasporangium oryzae]|uniref:hypothetical protein n=1 Tax=Intrasporangium oryzae TaxID=412687 RepID=UPI0004BBC9AB|nr:hypothetical protein [Intrasporangium oryzae]